MPTKNPHKKLGNRIKKILDMSGELQKDIAKKSGCQPTEISRWVRGEVAPSYGKLVAIARACKLKDLEIGWLFDGKGISPSYIGYEKEEKLAETTTSETLGKHSKDKPLPIPKTSALLANTNTNTGGDQYTSNGRTLMTEDSMYRIKYEQAQTKIIELLEENAKLKGEQLPKKVSLNKRMAVGE